MMIEQRIGGVQGSGGTGLTSSTFDILGTPGDTNSDTLLLGPTNGATNGSGATGYSVVLQGDAETGLSGTVEYRDGSDTAKVDFNGFEQFAFVESKSATVKAANNDIVDATKVTSDLTLDTGVGDDVVNFGRGHDTFKISKDYLGNDTVDGGDGIDTFHVAFSSTGRTPITFKGTTLFQDTPLVAEIDANNSVTLTSFEVIKSAGGADVFTGGYAAETLDSIEMGNGNDVFGWLTFNGDELNIDAGARNDTVGIGGNTGSGRTGLINGDVKGGTGTDKLVLGVTNGHDGATGFKVVIENDTESTRSFMGTVTYDGLAENVDGPQVDFTGFEAFTFFNANNAGLAGQNSDVVDATATTRSLSLDTGIGADTVNFGSGKDTFAVSKATFGLDVVDGGAGTDTFHVNFSSTSRQPFTFNGTNFNDRNPLTASLDANNKVTLTNFEVIKSALGDDTFTGGYASRSLQSIDMGGGDDTFGWLTFRNDALNIDAGRGNDTVKIGADFSGTATGLFAGVADGGTGNDTLALRYTDQSAGTGFKVVIGNEGGTVENIGVAGQTTTFKNFETFEFSNGRFRSDLNDVIDASTSTAKLTINAADGDDTITVGGGNDMLTGGRGADTFAFVGKFGKDTITDFDSGDMIVLEAANVVTGVSTSNGDTVITTADGWITLDNVTGFDMTNIGLIIDTGFFA